jgi:putative ABC transport system permease protein
MQSLIQDLRYGARMLLKAPGFTLIAVITLALGIGANTAIFTVVNTVLLRPLSYSEPERIMRLAPEWPNESFRNASEPKFIFWREHSQAFDGVAATIGIGSGVNLSGGSEPEFVTGVRVSADFFRVLGVNPAIGRGFTKEEDSQNGERVVILSHGLWQRRFGADPAIAGKSVSIDGNNYAVVGVMPENFTYGARQLDVFVPVRVNPSSANEGHNYTVLARLKPGVSRAQALADMKSVFEQFKSAYPKQLWPNETGVRVESYLASLTAEARPMLLILFGAVSFVLLIACANVANLLLTQATARRKEMALRQALGASRLSLARQLLTEGVLLALIGGGIGLLLAVWGVEALMALMPQGLIPRSGEIGFDWRVLVFTLGVASLTGLIFALAPALQAARVDVNHALKEGGGKGAIGGERGRLRSALVIAEIALAITLLAGAGVLIRTFANLRQVDPGFDPGNVLTFEVAPNGKQYETTDQNMDYFRRALERLKALPGVESVAVTSNLPLGAFLNLGVGIAGIPDSMNSTEIRMVTPDYFKVMKMSVLRGRAFTDADSAGAPPSIIVNEAYARWTFPHADPISQSLTVQGEQVYQIVGVVNDVKQFSLGDPAPRTVFIPVAQTPDGVMRLARRYVTMKFAIRASGDPLALGAAVKREMLKVDPSLPLTNMRSLEQIVARSLAQQRFNSTLLSLFAALGLLLAAIGVYGVMSYVVTQRTHEIGVRVALGARASDVLRLIVGKGMALALAGVALGLGASFALTRLMKDFLFGVRPADPLTFGVSASLLTIVALIACYVPARRATRVDPMVALRRE